MPMHGVDRERVVGLSPRVLSWVQQLRWTGYANEAMNLYCRITKKLLHILTNRCMRDPHVQWCERRSLTHFESGPSTRLGCVFIPIQIDIIFLHILFVDTNH